jgi:hypothetical protein
MNKSSFNNTSSIFAGLLCGLGWILIFSNVNAEVSVSLEAPILFVSIFVTLFSSLTVGLWRFPKAWRLIFTGKILLLSFISLYAFENPRQADYSIEKILSKLKSISKERYCEDITDPKNNMTLSGVCQYMKRLSSTGIASLSGAEQCIKSDTQKAPVGECSLRYREEPLLHYKARSIKRNFTEVVDNIKNETPLKADYSSVRNQFKVLKGLFVGIHERTNIHYIINSPKPNCYKTWAVKLKSHSILESCRNEFYDAISRNRPISPSLAIGLALAELHGYGRYSNHTIMLKNLFMYWDAPAGICMKEKNLNKVVASDFKSRWMGLKERINVVIAGQKLVSTKLSKEDKEDKEDLSVYQGFNDKSKIRAITFASRINCIEVGSGALNAVAQAFTVTGAQRKLKKSRIYLSSSMLTNPNSFEDVLLKIGTLLAPSSNFENSTQSKELRTDAFYDDLLRNYDKDSLSSMLILEELPPKYVVSANNRAGIKEYPHFRIAQKISYSYQVELEKNMRKIK